MSNHYVTPPDIDGKPHRPSRCEHCGFTSAKKCKEQGKILQHDGHWRSLAEIRRGCNIMATFLIRSALLEESEGGRS